MTIDAMWTAIKDAMAQEGIPCGHYDTCRSCGELRDAISTMDRYVGELMGRGFAEDINAPNKQPESIGFECIGGDWEETAE